MKFYRTEQVEIHVVGGFIYAIFRNMDEIAYREHGGKLYGRKCGRLYSQITDSSLGRIIRALNDRSLFKLSIRQSGRILSFIADRNHDKMWNTKRGD